MEENKTIDILVYVSFINNWIVSTHRPMNPESLIDMCSLEIIKATSCPRNDVLRTDRLLWFQAKHRIGVRNAVFQGNGAPASTSAWLVDSWLCLHSPFLAHYDIIPPTSCLAFNQNGLLILVRLQSVEIILLLGTKGSRRYGLNRMQVQENCQRKEKALHDFYNAQPKRLSESIMNW